MKEVDYGTAVDLHAIGYEGCYTTYYKEDGSSESVVDNIVLGNLMPEDGIYPAPRVDDASYFLRERYGISIEAIWLGQKSKWVATSYIMSMNTELYSANGESFDEVLESVVVREVKRIRNRMEKGEISQ